LRALRVPGAARRRMVRGAPPRGGDGGGVGAGRLVPGDTGGRDVGAGATGRSASSYSARGGRDGHRGEPRPDRAVGRRAHRLPRSRRYSAAGAGRRTHARSEAVIRRTKIVVTLGPATATPERIAGLIDVGARVLLDDGLLSVEVTRIARPRVEGRVVDGGTLTSHKGMNLPGLHVSAPALTEKDREDAGHAVGWGVDYVALSFVRRADDVAELRRLVPPAIKLVAKIEKAAALEDLDGILRVSDAVM